MTRTHRIRYDFTWRRNNVAGLVVMSILAWSLMLALGHVGDSISTDPAIPVAPLRVAAATERIDPNTASVASLRRLGGMGRVRAEAIVAYRCAHGSRPFECVLDLTKVNGIGGVTAQRIERHLKFD